MNVSRDARITQPFVLTPRELRKLCESIEKSAQIKFLKAECADKIEREFPSLTELLAYENPPNKAIENLRIYAYSTDTTVWIRFHKDLWNNVSFTIDGPERNVMPIIESIEHRLSAIRPWYALAALPDFRGLLLEGVCALITSMAVQRVVVSKLSNTQVSDYYAITTLVTAIIVLTILINILVTKLRKKYFSSGVFAIGQGAVRHQNQEMIRTVIIFSFLLEIAGGVTIAIIYS